MGRTVVSGRDQRRGGAGEEADSDQDEEKEIKAKARTAYDAQRARLDRLMKVRTFTSLRISFWTEIWPEKLLSFSQTFFEFCTFFRIQFL